MQFTKTHRSTNWFISTFKGSGGPVIIPNCNLQIFRILRENEEEHWNTKGWGKLTGINDNWRLLWHGTSIANIQSILKNGLQDPNGLGGVYFANRAGVRWVYYKTPSLKVVGQLDRYWSNQVTAIAEFMWRWVFHVLNLPITCKYAPILMRCVRRPVPLILGSPLCYVSLWSAIGLYGE